MLYSPLLQPLLHGAAGPWDEIVNLIPIAAGGLLLLYLYLASRRRARAEAAEADDHASDLPQ